MRTIALDLGKASIDWCEVEAGKVVGRGRVQDLHAMEPILSQRSGPVRVGFEACREALHVHDLMLSWGHVPYVFDTTCVRSFAGIGQHGRKNDRIDAERLAIALERNHARFAHVLSQDARRLRELQEQHRALVEMRKRLVIHTRGILRGRGIDVPTCAIENFVSNLRKAEQQGTATTSWVDAFLAPLEALEPEIAKVDLAIHALCTSQKDPVVERLASVPGVSLLVAAAFISVVDSADRFDNASQVSSYLGLCPGENSTGGRRKLGSITKQGNPYARGLLVQAAWCVLRSRDTKDQLVRWAHKTSQRRGRMRAAVAVARRLSRILYSLWKHGTYYDPRGTVPLAPRDTDGADADHEAKALKRAKSGLLKLAKQKRVHQRTLQTAKLSEGPSAN
jgi:transposase